MELNQNPHTHQATLGGETISFAQQNYETAVGELVGRHPGLGAPLVVSLAAPAAQIAKPTVDPLINETGRLRAMIDESNATENGFTLRPPVYSIGTRVNELGIENVQNSQEEHEKKPLAREAAKQLAWKIHDEAREDLPAYEFRQLKLTTQGQLVVGVTEVEPGRYQGGQYLGVEEAAFGSLVRRTIPAKSAASYLADCSPLLRAKNFNHWSLADDGKTTHVLRTRLSGVGGSRSVFAAVSERYTPFDGDKIAEALALAFPEDARGSLDYDGQRYRVEGLWHSDVAAEEFVAGEIFKAGVIVRGADDGSGSIRVQSVLWRNLCRNLIILDKAIGVDVRIRHTGTVRELSRTFQESFGKALTSIEPFRRAWAGAMQERDSALVERSNGTTSYDLTAIAPTKVLAGLFNGLLEREMVRIPGRSKDIVPRLLDCHAADEARDAYGVSRASIVNALTRYAHQVETDAFTADQIREDAGSLLSSGRRGAAPEPIPYVSFESF